MPEHNDELIDRIAAHLRQAAAAPLAPDFAARVMRQVESLPRHRRGGAAAALRWFIRPRTLQVSPLGGLAVAAGLGAFILIAGARTLGRPSGDDHLMVTRPSAPGLVLAGSGARRVVQFVLFAPGAKSVTLVGDFNDWDRTLTPLQVTHPGGVWSVSVPLPPGRHRYAFVVDGTRWLADPAAPPPSTAADDDYGDPNSIVTVGA